LYPVLATGPDIESFRGVELQAVEEFAAQGDSAAMAVLGAASVLRALGKDDGKAVAWLLFEEWDQSFALFGREFSSAQILALNDAAYWFYQSALHGRLRALGKYGEVRSAIFGGPVGLGWLTQTDYAALNSGEKTAINVSNVYMVLANDLAPEIKMGPLGLMFDAVPETELQLEIRSKLQTEFNQAHDESGLPPISVPPAATVDFEEILSQACSNDGEN